MKPLLLCLSLFVAPAWGQVYKCVDENGAKVYSDKPCSPTAKRLLVLKQADGVGGVPAPVGQLSSRHGRSVPTECKFAYTSRADTRGKALAENATTECVRNIALKQAGKAREASLSDYVMWRDYQQAMGLPHQE